MTDSSLPVELRLAVFKDADLLLRWRNDPVTRSMSIHTDEVTPEAHYQWLQKTLSRPDRILLIAQHEGAPVGQVRFDLQPKETEISITLSPDFRGKGLAVPVIQAALVWYRSQGSPQRILAQIKESNEPSKRTFLRCGFQKESTQLVNGDPVEQWYYSYASNPDS